jgi:hypothetical protein
LWLIPPYIYNIWKINDLNIGKILASQMVHCLWVKMTNQRTSYFDSKKYHTLFTIGDLNWLVQTNKVVFWCLSFGVFEMIIHSFVRVCHNHNHYYNMMHYQLKFTCNLNLNFMVLNQIERTLMEDCSLYIYNDLQKFIDKF